MNIFTIKIIALILMLMGPYRRVLSGLAYMVSVAGKISGTAVFLCTGGGVPAYKKSKEISAASISGKCRNGIF